MKRNLSRARSLRVVLPGALLLTVGVPLAARASAVTSAPSARPAALVPSVLPSVSNITAASCSSTFELWAKVGTTTIDGTVIPIWGYTDSATGTPTLPGPTLYACPGVPATVTLHNQLPEATAIDLQGQAMVPDRTGAAPGGDHTYTFTPTPGTYLYEAGFTANQDHQVPMGLYGALVVQGTTAGRAYAAATSGFDDEAVVVTSEIDPALNANPVGFDMRNFKPTYGLVNGQVSPAAPAISASAPGSRLLLRYVNAGVQPHSMALLGLNETVVAYDGSELAHPRKTVAETFGPGQTADAVVTIPVSATAGTKYALYDGSFTLHNGRSAGVGGMLTFIDVASGAAAGPTATITSFTSTGVSATLGATATAAEYFLGTPGTAGTGTALTVAAGTGSATFADLGTGTFTVFVHASDGTSWGPWSSQTASFGTPAGDTAGPAVSGVAFTPAYSNGSTAIGISATASDVATGGSNVTAVTYQVDSAPAVPMTLNLASPTVDATGTIAAGLAPGTHTVTLVATDAAGNPGTATTATLVIDATSPVTSTVTVSPNPSNGAVGVNSSTAAIRVTAKVDDTAAIQSPVVAAEAFVTTVGTSGAGIVMNPADGQFGGITENVTLDIPLSTASTWTANTTIWVHGKDAAGNWGTAVPVTLVIDKTGPAVSGVAVNPTQTGSDAVTVTASATDAIGPIVAAEFFVDGVGTNGTGTAMNVGAGSPAALTGNLSNTMVAVLANGTHTVYVHARDKAGNWGATGTTTVKVDHTGPTVGSLTPATTTLLQGTGGPATYSFSGVADNTGGVGLPAAPVVRWWFDANAPSAPVSFTGTAGTLTLDLSSLAPGSHTLNVQAVDAVGNWGAARTATVTVTPDAVFSDSFAALLGPWSSRSTATTSRLTTVAGGADTGSQLQAQGNNTNYVQYNFGTAANPATTSFDARFYFNPNNNGSSGQAIFQAATNNAFTNVVFHVRYRRNGSQPQVQLQVGGTANATWVNITNNSLNRLEVVKTSAGALTLYVNGVSSQTLTIGATTSIGAFRLGSVTGGGSSTVEYFDKFSAKRSTSLLVGP